MSRQSLAYAVIRDTTQKKHIRVLSKAKIIPKYSQSQSYAGLLPFKSLGHFQLDELILGWLGKFSMLVLPLVRDFHDQGAAGTTSAWRLSSLDDLRVAYLPRCPANKLPYAAVKPEAPNANTASRMIWMGKFWKAPWKWEPRLGPYDWWMMETIYGNISNLYIHSAPHPDTYIAMTGHLLPVHGFEKIKKRHLAGQGFRYRNDILGLGKQEDRCGLMLILNCKSYPLLDEITRSQNSRH